MTSLRLLTVAACTCMISVRLLVAAEQTSSERKAQRQQLIREFDKDNSGKLDQQERKALQEHLKAGRNSTSKPAPAKLPPGVKRIADVAYARVNDKPLLLDIFLPEKPGKPLPVIVWIHGGAWVSGDKSNCPIAPFAAKGYAVVSIEYRLTGQAQFPAQINDCKAAVRWVRAHAVDYGFDPDRVGACGGSAGGHLVALLGTSGGVRELEGDVGGNVKYSSRVQAVCDLCGPTDFTREEYVRDAGRKQPAVLERALIAFLGGPWEEKRQLADLASPVYFVSKDDPPFLVVHGDADNIIPVKHSQALYDKLKGAGVEVILKVVKGAGHGVGAHPGVLDQIAAFFDKHLKKDGRPA